MTGDTTFPRFSCLLKSYEENTMDKEEKDFLKKSFCARVVMKNAYGKLEGRWKILFNSLNADCLMLFQ